MGIEADVERDSSHHPSKYGDLGEIHDGQESSEIQRNVDLATDEQEVLRDEKSAARMARETNWVHEISKGSKGDAALHRARRRNAIRLKQANEKDAQIMSKYLPSDIAVFFPFGI